MIAQTLTFLVLAAAAVSAKEAVEVTLPLEGVDPNTLSCDPTGQNFLNLPHFEECNKFFVCDHGKEVERICPETLIFDFVLQVCNWEWATNCTLRNVDEEGSGFGSGEGIIEDYGEEAGPVEILPEESDNVASISADAAKHFNSILNCNRADSAARQVPYKGDCQRYWKCVSGAPQAVYCTDGLFFNENNQQCDFEANARCNVEPADELDGEYILYK